jgi:peptide/nickel transport system permease protein
LRTDVNGRVRKRRLQSASPASEGGARSTKPNASLVGFPARVRRKLILSAYAASLLVVLCLILLGSWLAPYDPNKIDVAQRLRPLSRQHIFGTDELGRDVFSRVLSGARVTLPPALFIPLLAALVGLVMGSISGFIGGKLDTLLMRICDLSMGFPPLLLAMALITALGPGIPNIVIALVSVLSPAYTRLVRGEVMAKIREDYVAAAVSIGASNIRVVRKHIIPNIIAPIIVKATMDVGNTILIFSFLGFIGVGVRPPTPEWGILVAQGRRFLIDYWWYPTFPGLAILTTSVLFTLLGDGLNDYLNPRRRVRMS